MRNFDVEVSYDEQIYKAKAVVEGNTLTVTSLGLGSKSASISGDSEFLAKILLIELVNQSKGRGWK